MNKLIMGLMIKLNVIYIIRIYIIIIYNLNEIIKKCKLF